MVKLTPIRVMVTFLIVMGIVLSLAGCGEGETPQAQGAVTVSYTFPFVPITFSIDTNGHISVGASATLVTELGTVAVSGGVSAPFTVPNNSLLLTIRHKQDGNLVDTNYQINTGEVGNADVQGNISEVKVAWNGNNNSIFIDASHGDITSITIQGQGATPQGNTPVSTTQSCPSFQVEDLGLWVYQGNRPPLPSAPGDCQVIVAHGDINNSGICHMKVFHPGESVDGLGNGTFKLVRITGSQDQIQQEINSIQQGLGGADACPFL